MDNKIICVVGPTASGKTSLGIDIAKMVDGEIVCADSMQIYKYFDIGTAKPTKEEQSCVLHHLFDCIDPLEDFSVVRYVEMASEIITDIKKRGKIPVIVGGTGLYIDALIKGNDFAKNDDSNAKIRQDLVDIAKIHGNEYLHNMLLEIDIDSYNKLHPNDIKRVVRAIEVYKVTGKTITQHNFETQQIPPKYDALMFGINPKDRQVLYDRINKRVDIMMENGLLEETKSIINNGKFLKTASQAIGYKELMSYISDEDTLENCVDKIKQESRRYAKRQITWFSKNKNINWLECIGEETKLLTIVQDIIKEKFDE